MGMRKLALLPLLVLLVVVVAHAAAPDVPALPDGTSRVTSKGAAPGDGGGPWRTVDTGQLEDWTASIRVDSYRGSPSVYYRFSSDGGTATTDDQLLTTGNIYDLPISQGYGEKYRYFSVLGLDGGAPDVNLYRNAR